MKKHLLAAAVAAISALASSNVSASGIPTIDVANLAQNIVDYTMQVQQIEEAVTQVQQGIQAIEEARRQVAEAQRAYDSLNGIRDLGSLLNSDLYNDARNYLPTGWQDTLRLGNDISNGRYSSLKGVLEATKKANRIYENREALGLPADSRAIIVLDEQERIANEAAVQNEISLTASENRFEELQEYKNRINTSADQKAVLDLQASMSAESLMMQNELIQIMLREQKTRADQLAARTQARERTLKLTTTPYDSTDALQRARARRDASGS